MPGQVQLRVQDNVRRAPVLHQRSLKQYSDTDIYAPTAWRIAGLFLMTCAAGITFRLAVHATPRSDRSEFIDWQQEVFNSNAKGFFLDIGAAGIASYSSTRYLEERGWRGICSDPFPHNLENRACKLVSMPVGPKTGEKVMIQNCSNKAESLKRLFTHLAEGKLEGALACPMTERSTVGIRELLEMTDVPSVVDYASLDTEGSELEILQAFPFDRTCVRTWRVKYGFMDSKISGIRRILEPHGCQLKDGAGELIVRCPCDGPASNSNEVQRGNVTVVAAAAAVPTTRPLSKLSRRIQLHAQNMNHLMP